MNARKLSLRVNGRAVEADVNVRTNLADFLRQQIGLTGTHVGCEHGACGACTIIVDGRPVRSCLMLAVQAYGAEVETVEGLGTPQSLAFSSHTLEALLRVNSSPTRDEIRDVLSGNLCRCTGYQGIVDAALDAADARRGGR